MAEELPIANAFSVDLRWPVNPGTGGNVVVDESIARVEMKLGETSITAYQSENGDKSDALPVPTYYLAEWLAQNWWAFLYEPRKIEREEAERDFRGRHWLGSARNGFALPDVTFASTGDSIEIVARASYLRFARLNFTQSAIGLVETSKIRQQLSTFVDSVIERLNEKGIKNTAAHESWARVKATSPDEEAYCRLVGSLGLCPYVAHGEIDADLEAIAEKIPETMLSDLCDATNVLNFNRISRVTNEMSVALEKAHPATMKELMKTDRPPDSRPRAYEWGYLASDVARSALGIAHDDPSGHKVFFDKLELDPNLGIESVAEASQIPLVTAAASRSEDKMRVAILGTNHAHRKFAAARASFLTWSRDRDAARLVTTARTRTQQASRAFAAELLAPVKFLRRKLGDRAEEVSPFTIDRISEEIEVASSVVRYQALNDGYFIAEAA